jgi:hypothetical protein
VVLAEQGRYQRFEVDKADVMRTIVPDSRILDVIRQNRATPDAPKLTLHVLGGLLGITHRAIHRRLRGMRERGLVTWHNKSFSTLRVIERGGTSLPPFKFTPVGHDPNEIIEAFIHAYWNHFHCGPTYREIGEACYFSEPAARHYVKKLVAEGSVTTVPGKWRSIRLVNR